jgi:hypothetical protein
MQLEMISIYEGIILLGALIGVYVKMTSEIGKLKNRTYSLEQSKDEVKDLLTQLGKDIADIKLLLARKQIDR